MTHRNSKKTVKLSLKQNQLNYRVNQNITTVFIYTTHATCSFMLANKLNDTTEQICQKFVKSQFVRSSHQRCSLKKGVLRNFAKFAGKNCARVSFLIKLQTLGVQLNLKNRLWHGYFSVNFAKFLREHLQNTWATAAGQCKHQRSRHFIW